MDRMRGVVGSLAVILLLYLIAVVPAFYIIGSLAESLLFGVLLLVLNVSILDFVSFVRIGSNYFNPLKIVDGRYGMTNAWILLAPIGMMGAFSVLSAVFLSSISVAVF